MTGNQERTAGKGQSGQVDLGGKIWKSQPEHYREDRMARTRQEAQDNKIAKKDGQPETGQSAKLCVNRSA